MTTPIAYRSFAKINLYLDVLNRRRDGYHNIETVFQTVGLGDELWFSEQHHGISLECAAPELESIEENLAYRAAKLLLMRTGYSQGVYIQLAKHIPIAAGLAGGSGNAAATLLALNRLWGLGLSLMQLSELAIELGSDVPYCLIGGIMAATGRGERLAALAPLGRLWFVLLHPRIAVSATRVYNSPRLNCSGERPFAGRTASFRKALRALQKVDFATAVFNRMEEPVLADHPHLAEAKDRLLQAGCLSAAMSGSGPTLFGICRTKRDASRIATRFPEYKTSVVRNVPAAIERIQ